MWILFVLLLPNFSLADVAADAKNAYQVFCGEGRSGGEQKADFALVDFPEDSIRIYLKGRQLPEEEYAVRGVDYAWIITIFSGDKAVKKFTVDLKTKTLEELQLLPVEKIIGEAKPCIIPEILVDAE